MKVAAPVKAASKKLPAKPKPVVRRSVAPDPRVRPLGVLPPESRARVVERPLPVPVKVVKARPNPRKPVEPVRIQGAQRLTDKDMKEFEGRLMAERQRIMKEMGHLENTVLKVNQRDSSGDLSGYSFHMADAGTDAIEREKAFMFASVEGRMLLEINEALRRLYRGEYGVCESCGKPIARARLEAMPYARLCVSCKELEERASRGAQ
jgi:RNA polymerase-binding protein DksA